MSLLLRIFLSDPYKPALNIAPATSSDVMPVAPVMITFFIGLMVTTK